MTELVTQHLILRRPTAGDFEALYQLTNDPDVSRYLGASPIAQKDAFSRLLQNAGSWSLYGYGSFMVCDRDTGGLIGNCGIFRSFRGLGADFDDMPEAGWIIGREHWGLGYAREAMEAALGWFDQAHGRQKIVAMIETGNNKSVAIATSLGFTPTRTVNLDEAVMQLFCRI